MHYSSIKKNLDNVNFPLKLENKLSNSLIDLKPTLSHLVRKGAVFCMYVKRQPFSKSRFRLQFVLDDRYFQLFRFPHLCTAKHFCKASLNRSPRSLKICIFRHVILQVPPHFTTSREASPRVIGYFPVKTTFALNNWCDIIHPRFRSWSLYRFLFFICSSGCIPIIFMYAKL